MKNARTKKECLWMKLSKHSDRPMYKVEFLKSAFKELEGLDKKDRARILDAIKALSLNPFSELLKYRKIKASENLFRIRIGDYRVVYTVEKDALVITIIRLGHRKEVYRGLH